MNRRCLRKISLRHTGQRDRRRLHLRHMQACPQGIRATCTARTMHTLQSLPGTPGGPSPFWCPLRLPVPSSFSGIPTTVSSGSPAQCNVIVEDVIGADGASRSPRPIGHPFPLAHAWDCVPLKIEVSLQLSIQFSFLRSKEGQN